MYKLYKQYVACSILFKYLEKVSKFFDIFNKKNNTGSFLSNGSC